MKIALKNFLTTLRRYKTASALNIAGLTLAFAAFYIIMAQVRYDVTFNRSIADSESICLMITKFYDKWMESSSRVTAEAAIEACPDVEAGGAFHPRGGKAGRVWVRSSDYGFDRFDTDVASISLPLLDVLSFRTVAGDLRRLSDPGSVIVSKSMAERMGITAGDAIWLPDSAEADEKPSRQMTVAGVYADFAENTMMGGVHVLVDAGDDQLGVDYWGWRNYQYYVKLREGADPHRFARVWMTCTADLERQHFGEAADYDSEQVRLLPVGEVFYSSEIYSSNLERGSKDATAVMFGIAMLIVAMAFINFVNFFFALIPSRLRGVNICKVFGASVGSLRLNFLFEAVALCVCSLLLALYLMIAVQESPLAGYMSCSLSLADNLPTMAAVLAVVVVMALAASLYPAWYITSFNASLAAKGGFAGSAAGRRMRTVLVGIQFAISMTLIIVATVFWLQYDYVKRFDMGFDRENILTFRTSHALAERSEAFASHFDGNPDIVGITASSHDVIGNDNTVSWQEGDRMVVMRNCGVRSNFFEVMGIPIIEGESFASSQAGGAGLIVNRRMAETSGRGLGDRCPIGVIRGIAADVYMYDVTSDMECMGWLLSSQSLTHYYVRVRAGADIKRVYDFIRDAVHEFDPTSEEPAIEFLDSRIERLYSTVKRQTVFISLFALLSVVISLMGVFGIVLFETQHRRREIAIRRVFGASTDEIVWMLDRRYAVIVTVCFVVAAPVAWWIARGWLAAFRNRIDLSWWIFAAAIFAVAAVTIGLVTLRSLRAAGENPARVLGKD